METDDFDNRKSTRRIDLGKSFAYIPVSDVFFKCSPILAPFRWSSRAHAHLSSTHTSTKPSIEGSLATCFVPEAIARTFGGKVSVAPRSTKSCRLASSGS